MFHVSRETFFDVEMKKQKWYNEKAQNLREKYEKSEVRKAIERSNDLGDLIDKIIYTLDKCENSYLKYCKIKSNYIAENSEKDTIFTEIDNELNFENSNNRENEE